MISREFTVTLESDPQAESYQVSAEVEIVEGELVNLFIEDVKLPRQVFGGRELRQLYDSLHEALWIRFCSDSRLCDEIEAADRALLKEQVAELDGDDSRAEGTRSDV